LTTVRHLFIYGRVRTASTDVVGELLSSGADPNARNAHNYNLTPLTLLLLKAASTTGTGMSLIYNNVQSKWASNEEGGSPSTSPHHNNPNWPIKGLKFSADDDVASPGLDSRSLNSGIQTKGIKSSGKKIWIKVAELLVKCGGSWDGSWRSPHGCTQLHLLLSSFPPSRDESAIFRNLVKSALDSGLSVSVEDSRGRSPLFILCEQLATTPSDQAPDATRLVHMLIDVGHEIGGSDRTGRTIFDIVETVPHSCLHACKSILTQATNGSKSNKLASGNSKIDWEKSSISRVPSAVIANSTRANNDGKKTSAEFKKQAINSTNRYEDKGMLQQGRTSRRNYFDSDED
jgi:hypothetical protein